MKTSVTTRIVDQWRRFLGVMLIAAFMVSAANAAVPTTVNLGTAGDFVILAKTGISTTGVTSITGDIGVSPIAATAITGFGLIKDASGTFSKSSLVTGNIYAANYTSPTPTKMTTAIGDMQTAYTDAAGRSLPDFTEFGSGDITSKTLTPGLYKWGTGVLVSAAGVTISGSATDVWIFQIAQNLSVANGAIVTLSGGAQASNIFWQVAGNVTIGTTAAMKGIILCQTQIAMQTGATLNGRALAQTSVTLDANAVTTPAVVVVTPPAVSSANPGDAAIGVALNQKIAATFSKPMNASTITASTFTLMQGTSSVPGVVSYSGTTATFAPASNFAPNTLYTATITTGAKDLSGIALSSDKVWSFTTGGTVVVTPPSVNSANPGDVAIGVALNHEISVTFSVEMDPATLTASTFTLTQGITSVPGGVSCSGTTATFTPANDFAPNTLYSATITTGAMDLTGNALANNFVWSFTTGAAVTAVESGLAPQRFSLLQNYPNPFNPSTRIQYSLEKAGKVSLKIYNVLGLEVAILVNAYQEANSYTVLFNANEGGLDLSSGVYFYRLEAGSFVSTKRLILVK